MFGYLPHEYIENFSEKIIDRSYTYTLTGITYNLSPIENYSYIILKSKNSKKAEMLLDADSFYEDTGDSKNLLTPIVNIEYFNKLLELKYISVNESIKFELINLIARYNEEVFFVHTIEEIEDLRILPDKYSTGARKRYVLLIDDFEPNFDKYHYVWFGSLGLFELLINIENGKLKSFTDEIIFGPSFLFVGTEVTE